ncbi:hypothetical protein KUCAC02_026639, partial [Chaenocephalus aceratus]
DIKQAIKDRCNKATAAKCTNDPMHGEVKSVFKEKTEAEIKGYIRQKLSNSAKILKRKTFKKIYLFGHGYHIHVTASVKPEPVQMKDIIFCRGATLLPKMPSSPKPQTFVRGGPVSVRPGALCISSSRHRGVPPHWDPSAET